MFLLGILLIIGIFLWRNNLRFEWNIPQKWLNIIESWQEKLSCRRYNLTYIWYMGEGYSELEKNFYDLQMILPSLEEKLKVPLWIKVFVYQGSTLGLSERYISCLRRRFPGIEIQECSSNESNSLNKREQP